MMRVLSNKSMKRFVDTENETIWYYSESGFPTYMALSAFRRQNPSYKHQIASKEYFKLLQKGEINSK